MGLTEMNEAEVAWLAGIVEGEGSIFLHPRKDRPRPQPRVQAGMTDEDIIRRMQALAGGRVYGPYVHEGRLGKKPRWEWHMYGGSAVQLIRTIRPWLGVRRGERADAVIAAWESPAKGSRS